MGNKSDTRLDDKAVTECFRTCERDLFYFLLGLLRDEATAADVLQSTFTKLIEQGGGVAPEAIRSWLFTVARNAAIERRRRDAMEQRHQQGVSDRARAMAREAPGTIRDLVVEEQIDALRAAIRKLPEEQAIVLKLRVFGEQKFAEIAKNLGLPLGTVLTRMRSALEKLRRAMMAVDGKNES